MHNKKQIDTKKKAIRKKAENFAIEYLRKGHGWNDETLYYNIEDLHSLLKDLKREEKVTEEVIEIDKGNTNFWMNLFNEKNRGI